ncbi:MAG: 4Fe-4S dicluster domain-containing protein [Elusimicrobiota bacterium]|jgi:ferredoxin|nr:4Fe-4S dicluster domain-containing protein [Elusimicrobiota bacterium]
MKIFYFTGTGNSLSVAKKIGGQLYSIAQVIKKGDTYFEDDSIGIVFPCHGVQVPAMVAEFLKKVELKSQYFFAIMTYGKFSGTALQELVSAMPKARNFNFHYVNEILMIDNYLLRADINKELEFEFKKSIDKNIALIINDIRCRKINSAPQKGFFTKILSSIKKFFFLVDGKNDINFRVDKSCINCGVCQKVCPKGNILAKGKVSYFHNCDFCMACVHSCKLSAIHVKGEKNSKRYRNKLVALQEIIDSNNQNKTFSHSEKIEKQKAV